MDLRDLKAGDAIVTRDGCVAEVLRDTEDGHWILVRYLKASDPAIVGTHDLCHEDEVLALVGVDEPPAEA